MTERVEIIFTSRGSKVVRNNVEGIGRSARAAQSAVQLLNRALAVIGIAATIRSIVRLADTFTNLQNRIRTVTRGVDELQAVTKELFDISKDTRSSFEATTEVYARTALAVKDLGLSQRETLDFTKSLNQAVVLSGAGAQEASAALIQLSQGLASNTLRGDELRSVLEQLPVVADVIAKGLGITRGELREFGKAGKISAEAVLTAFRDARQELSERFLKTIPTISQSFENLRTNLIKFIADLDKATGASKLLSQTILFLSENLDTAAKFAGAAAIAVGVTFGTVAINRAVTGINLLTAAIARNPLGALAVAILTVSSLLIAFSDEIQLTGARAATLEDLFVSALTEITNAWEGLFDVVAPGVLAIVQVVESIIGPIEFTFTGILRSTAKFIDTYIGFWVGANRAIITAFANVPRVIQELFFNALQAVEIFVTNAINSIISGINTVFDAVGLDLIDSLSLGVTNNPAEGAAERTGEAIATAFDKGLNSVDIVTGFVDRVLGRAEDRATQRLENERFDRQLGQQGREKLNDTSARPVSGPKGLDDRAAILAREIQLLNEESIVLRAVGDDRAVLAARLEVEEKLRKTLRKANKDLTEEQINNLATLSAVEAESLEATVRRNLELGRQAELLETINGPQRTLVEQQTALQALFEQGIITLEQYNEQLRTLEVQSTALNNSFSGGLANGIARIATEVDNLGRGVSDIVVNAFNMATDAIVEFAKTGEFNVRKFFSSLFEQLLRLATQQLFAQLIGSFGGGAGQLGSLAAGAATTAAGSGGGFANGGRAMVQGQGGTDSQLVSLRATPGEEVQVLTPQQQVQTQAAAPAPPPNINVAAVLSPSDVRNAFDNPEGTALIINVLENERTTVQQIAAG